MEKFREFDPSSLELPDRKSEEFAQENQASIKDKLRKILLKTAALGLVFGPHMLGVANAQTKETRSSFAPAAAEKTEKKKNLFREREIRESLATDPKERIFLDMDDNPENELFEISGGEKSSGYLDFDQILAILRKQKQPVKEFTVLHTHPLSAYRNILSEASVSPQQQAEYEQGIKELPPHPPSVADFQSQVALEEYFGARKIKVKSRVIDASGTWDYSVENNKVILDLLKAQAEYAQALDTKLSDKQWDIVDQATRRDGVDPRMMAIYLKNKTQAEDPRGEMRKLGAILETLQSQVKQKYGESMSANDEVRVLGEKVILAESSEQQTSAIANYISACAKIGVKVEHVEKNIN